MATPYTGDGTKMGTGLESTWAVSVSRTVWTCLVSESIQRDFQRATIPSLCGSAAIVAKAKHDVVDNLSGDLVMLGDYDAPASINQIWAAMGAGATTGAGPYVHTLTLSKELPSQTIEVIKGDSTFARVCLGMMVSQLSVSIAPGGIMRVTPTYIGKTDGGLVSAGSATLPSANFVEHFDAGVFAWNSVNFSDITNFEVTIDNQLTTRNVLGSLNTGQPVINNQREIKINLTLQWSQNEFDAGLIAGTESDATITFTSGTDTMAFTGRNAYVESAGEPISAVGIITQNVVLRCLSDGVDEALSIVIGNATAGTAYFW